MKKGYQLFSAMPKFIDFDNGKINSDGLREVIRETGKMGYDGVEFFVYGDISAKEMKGLLKESGLEPVNSHVQLERWKTNFEKEIEYAKTVGLKFLTIPYVEPDDRTKEGYEALFKNISVWGEKCRENEITLCYHTHDFEFEKWGEGIVLDEILKADPEMKLELDTFWCTHAGYNPVEYMDTVADRLCIIHIKDYKGDIHKKPFPDFVAIGTGKMDNESIIKKAQLLGLEWVVVEQDNSEIDVMESAQISIKSMRQWC